MAVFFVFSAIAPRDAHFDAAHYHLQNGWSFWQGRLDQDLAPSEMHSFLNPIHSAIVWLFISHLPGPLAIGLLGLVQASILPALYALLARLAWRMKADVSPAMLMVIAFVSFASQPMMLMLSSVLNDHWGALGFILAFVLLMPVDRPSPSLKSLAMASAIVGLMFGLKLTNAVYVAGFAAAVLIVTPDHASRLKGVAVCAGVGLAGAIVTGGWWAWEMYERFGNPIFPNLNSLFGSPYGPDTAFRDEKFLPASFWEGVVRPIFFSFDASPINEQATRDFRLLAGYLAAFAILGLSVRALWQGRADARHRVLCALAAGFLVTFTVWTLMFSIQRYAMGLYIIGPVLMMGALWLVWPKTLNEERPRLALLVLMGALLLSTSFERLRRVPWQSMSEPYVWTKLPEGVDVSDAIIILSSYYPTGFTAPAFKDAHMLTHGDARPWSKPALANYRPLIQAEIDASERAIFAVMFRGQESGPEALERLAGDYHLKSDFEACQPMQTAFDSGSTHWILCPLTR
ncbi:hypothetical protein WNY37_00535 [Henriciella sp. AS95]|uniref:hypothetical protein n=1 Tax=Henriciella sp. AS95 TaxID=3135782 RepID=UPI0031747390